MLKARSLMNGAVQKERQEPQRRLPLLLLELLYKESSCSWSPPEVNFRCFSALSVLHLVPPDIYSDSELLYWLSGSTSDVSHHRGFAGWMLVCVWCWWLLQACSAFLAQEKWDSPGWCQYRLCLPCWEYQLPAPHLQSDGPSALPGRQCIWQRFSAFLWFPTCYFKCSRLSQDAWKFHLSSIAFIKWVILSQLPEDGCPHLNWHFI